MQKTLLNLIAKAGKVYGYPVNLGGFISNEGTLRPRLLGTSQASTFTGFCQKHDDEIFRDIEKSAIKATPRHACLLGYRSLCRELHALEGRMLLLEHLRSLDRGLPHELQIALQQQCDKLHRSTEMTIQEAGRRKMAFDNAITTGSYNHVRFCTIWLNRPPDIMCAGWTSPSWDYAGNRLQNLASQGAPVRSIGVSLVAAADKGCVFFSWLNNESDVCCRFVASLLRCPAHRIPNALVRFVTSTFENQFYRPDWWDGLLSADQDRIVRRLNDKANTSTPLSKDWVEDDGADVVAWRVDGVETNVSELASIALHGVSVCSTDISGT